MRLPHEQRHAVRVPHAVMVMAVASLVAGCSANSVRFSEQPMFAGSAASTAGSSVTQQALPAFGTPPTAQPATLAALRTRGWSVEEGRIVTVGAGDTATTLSQGFGVPVNVILEANGFLREDEVRVGQRIVIPKYVLPRTASAAGLASAPPDGLAADKLGAPPTSLDEQAREGRHIVQENDTLYSIARAHRVSVSDLAQRNGVALDYKVKIGERLRIPGGAESPTDVALAPTAPAPVVEPAVQEVSVPQTQAAQSSPPPAAAPPAEAAPAAGGGTRFGWPVEGRIVAGFGKQADGARNHGINVAVPAGTPVRAAESGTVIYAGDELEGYGNLVLVQHADDWVSAYAHNDALKVSRGDKVSRGQPIASVGSTGSVDEPQLHFELRKKSEPVDPLPHLQS